MRWVNKKRRQKNETSKNKRNYDLNE
jgi:hypothetical protein